MKTELSDATRFNESTCYDRKNLETKIVHLGFGAFHRGHQAVFTDLANQAAGENWGIFEVNLFGDDKLIDDLVAQDYLFSVIEKSSSNTCKRLVRCVSGAIHTPKSGIVAAIEKLAEPNVSIVSLTITEKGYCSDPVERALDFNNPLIIRDLENPREPISAVGLIVEGLRVRRARGLSGMSVMSCDNIPENGFLTKNVIVSYARQLDLALASWIESNVSFPNTMVDRIVPAMTPESFIEAENLLGITDPCGVISEDFKQWVIEDNFVSGRPSWDLVGAMFVEDVLPYEEMKLRMLNGSHSFLAYNGYISGFKYISECLDNHILRSAVYNLMVEEQAKSLNSNLKVDLVEYANTLLNRFSNQNIKHQTSQIAMDGSQKIPQRVIDPYIKLSKLGFNYNYLPYVIAAWMNYVISSLIEEREIVDPMVDKYKEILMNPTLSWATAKQLINISSIFGEVDQDSEFLKKIEEAFNNQILLGVLPAIEKISEGK